MTLADWQAVQAVLTKFLISGNWLKKSIEVDGDKVEFHSLAQLESYIDFVESQISRLSNPQGRTVMVSSGKGLF